MISRQNRLFVDVENRPRERGHLQLNVSAGWAAALHFNRNPSGRSCGDRPAGCAQPLMIVFGGIKPCGRRSRRRPPRAGRRCPPVFTKLRLERCSLGQQRRGREAPRLLRRASRRACSACYRRVGRERPPRRERRALSGGVDGPLASLHLIAVRLQPLGPRPVRRVTLS